MGRRKHKLNEEDNYLVQKFDKDVQCKGVPSRILLHFGLAHLVVGDIMRSLNSSSFIFPNVRMRSNLAGRLFLIWSCSVDLQQNV